jgi:acetyl-CoA synthetase
MDRPSVIRKTARDFLVRPNFVDYAAARRAFSWSEARGMLAGLPGGGVNIAFECADRHAEGAAGNKVALRFISRSAPKLDLTFAELAQQSRRFAHVLRSLGLGKGSRLFVLTGRIPELYVSVLGGLRNGTVVSPLFGAFGPEPIATRINLGAGDVLVTTDLLYERKIAKIRDQMPSLRHVLLVPETGATTSGERTLDLRTAMARADDTPILESTSAEDPALLHFTSGTTGTPKGAIHVHGAAVTHRVTGHYALDLHDDDVYWCTADPGWVTGTSYGIIAPLLHAVTSIVDREEFDAERWYETLSSERVSVWYTAPTAIRMLMRAGAELPRKHDLSALRFIASVGEPLNPEAVWWGEEALGHTIHDNWWQTETGGIMIANTAAFDVKPGSMGRPLPGIDAYVVERLPAAGPGVPVKVRVIEEPNEEGELALRRGWPSMFRGYLNDEQRYAACFSNDLYLTGDLVRRDADGYFWFVGRADDVIKSAGHLIGPFEVESALMEHPAVAEAAVIGKPDATMGQIVKAFVSLKGGFTESEALRRELLGHARIKLGAAVAPKEIAFVPAVPHTRSGKILRRVLKARELGLPEGDLSTLEGNA